MGRCIFSAHRSFRTASGWTELEYGHLLSGHSFAPRGGGGDTSLRCTTRRRRRCLPSVTNNTLRKQFAIKMRYSERVPPSHCIYFHRDGIPKAWAPQPWLGAAMTHFVLSYRSLGALASSCVCGFHFNGRPLEGPSFLNVKSAVMFCVYLKWFSRQHPRWEPKPDIHQPDRRTGRRSGIQKSGWVQGDTLAAKTFCVLKLSYEESKKTVDPPPTPCQHRTAYLYCNSPRARCPDGR